MLEEKIKEVWPTALGPCRFAFSNPQEIPVSILFLLSTKTIHQDGRARYRYQADVWTKTLSTDLVRNAIKAINTSYFTLIFEDYNYEYDEERKAYRHICDLFITYDGLN
jgi:hypothetical protein